MFPPGILRFVNVAKVLHGMLINLVVFNDFDVLFAKGASESSINDIFHKDSGTRFYSL